MVVAAYALNLLGLRIAGTVQGLVTAGVLGLVILILVFAARDVQGDAFVPFASRGWSAVGVAATQLFWAFVDGRRSPPWRRSSGTRSVTWCEPASSASVWWQSSISLSRW
jgi:hypothetical protein